MKEFKKTFCLLALTTFLCCLLAGTTVHAADVSLGLGVGLAPDYEGSEDYTGILIPYASAVWSNHMALDLLGNKFDFLVNILLLSIPDPCMRPEILLNSAGNFDTSVFSCS